MKKPSIKNVSLVWGAALLISGCIWIVAQSNANDETAITIDTNRYTATQHIQEVHLNDKSSSTRVWLKNEDGLVLGVGEVGTDERVGKLKNSVGGEASVIGGRNNENKGSESSLIVGGEHNRLANGKLGSVVMGGKSNQVNSSETVVLASKEAKTQGSGAVAVAVNGGQVLGDNSLFFAGDHSYVKKNDSMVIGSAVMMDGAWSFAFNAKREGIIADADHTFIVNADHGLIVGTNKNNGTGVSLTVNGAVRVWEAKGSAKDDDKQEGAIFRVACSSPAGASCLCANVRGEVRSISSNPACDQVCNGTNRQWLLNARCGTRARTDYAAAETTRRLNTNFCSVGSHVQGVHPNFPTVGEVSWTCASDFGGALANCSAKKKISSQLPQPVNGQCGTTKDSCVSGDFVDIADTATDYKWQCNGKNGGTTKPCSLKKPTQPVNGVCAKNVTVPVDGTKLVNYAKANPSLFCDPGTLVSPELSNGKLTWKCAWLNGWDPSQKCVASCPSDYSLQNGACIKIEKKCNIKIDKVSCKHSPKLYSNNWWIEYTYSGFCDDMGIIGSFDKDFGEGKTFYFAGPKIYPKGDSHIVNADWTITVKKYLTLPEVFPWPSDWFLKIEAWNKTTPNFSFSRPQIIKENWCNSPSPKPLVKIDRNGKPFEWEIRAIYESDRTKVGKILYMRRDCSGILANQAWFYAQCYKYVDSNWTPTWLEFHTTPMDGWWIIDRKNRELQLEPNHTYYMPCESNQRCSFEVDSWWYKIKNVKQYIWILWNN